jgi:hypothetical protein
MYSERSPQALLLSAAPADTAPKTRGRPVPREGVPTQRRDARVRDSESPPDLTSLQNDQNGALRRDSEGHPPLAACSSSAVRPLLPLRAGAARHDAPGQRRPRTRISPRRGARRERAIPESETPRPRLSPAARLTEAQAVVDSPTESVPTNASCRLFAKPDRRG